MNSDEKIARKQKIKAAKIEFERAEDQAWAEYGHEWVQALVKCQKAVRDAREKYQRIKNGEEA